MKPYFVAEISGNHLGSVERALQLIDAAAKAGADAVKIQTWSEMVVADYTVPSGPWAGRNLADLYDEVKTPWEWHESLFAFARGRGITLFSSVFDTQSLEFLESLDCPMYKISSFELVDGELIQAVATTGKPMILSTGMATEDEITRAVDIVNEVRLKRDLTVLKCSSAYPAPSEDLNLRAIPLMRECFNLPIGFSDHTIGPTAAKTATALGATMIEKHLTLRRGDGGPDAAFSAEPAEFWAMVQACKEVAKCLGEAGQMTTGPTPAELPQLNLRRSLYYAQDVPRGTVLTPGVIVTARPALGLPPAEKRKIMGMALTRDVKRGDPVSTEDFKWPPVPEPIQRTKKD